MENRKKKFLVIDTETASDVKYPLAYDIGAKVIDLDGNVYASGSWVVYEIYVGEREMMKSAYYAEKIPRYEVDLKNGSRQMKKFFNIRKILLSWLEEFNVEAVCAYNTNFDIRALNNVMRRLMKNPFVKFFPKSVQYIDIWSMASHAICGSGSYQKRAYAEEWYSDAGNVRTSAEKVYAFLCDNADFEESHTALEDVDIESQIFLYCWKKTKPEQRTIVSNPWRIPQKLWKYREAKYDGLI